MKSYCQAGNQIGAIIKNDTIDPLEIKRIKAIIQDSYLTFSQMHHPKIFLNLGLWDRKIHKEYMALNFNFSAISDVQDIHSQLLLYYLINPLIKIKFFNKRLLDIGSGNGLGLKAASELLKTNYALGVDLVCRLATNAHSNFYVEDKVNYIQSDSEKLPLEDESFDIITNLESSHLYPKIEDFFSEVERALSFHGFFCYTDHNVNTKDQAGRLEAFINKSNKLKIMQKLDITKMVQASLYRRLIVNEAAFYKTAVQIIGPDEDKIFHELPTVAAVCGLIFLPWWKIWFRNPALRRTAQMARNDTFWGKKHYFYYFIQKIKK